MGVFKRTPTTEEKETNNRRTQMDNSIIKELELNGWEVTAAEDTEELDIEKGRLIFMGPAGYVFEMAKKMNQHDWVALEEESEQHCMIESTVKLLDKIYGTRDGTQS